MDKFIVSGTPHVRSKDSIQGIMRDVLIGLTPAALMGIYVFGINALVIMVISIASAIFFEYLYQKLMKKPITITDLSAAVTGLLLAMNMPASAPYWMPIVGSAFAIIIAKQLFGGLGQNFINPALAARAFLLASYPTAMTTWPAPAGQAVDAVSVATPLALLKAGDITVATSGDMVNALVGTVGGCIGETSAIALIIGGVYLIVRHVISWRIPVVYIATVFILTALIGRNGVRIPQYEILVGGLMLGAFFMATDYVTSPITPRGQIVFGVLLGVLTGIFRIFGASAEGVSYAIIICNLLVPLIEKVTIPVPFGKEGIKDGK